MSQFAGDEVGMKLFLEEVRLKARDHSRSPIQVNLSFQETLVSDANPFEQWNSQEQGGFSSGVPWMRVNDDYPQCNAEQQLSDQTSVLAYWRRLLELRKLFWSVFVYGKFEMVEREHPCVVCYRRSGKAGVATVALNFNDNDQDWSMPSDIAAGWESGVTLLANYGEPRKLYGQTLSLRPFEAIVVFEHGDAHHL